MLHGVVTAKILHQLIKSSPKVRCPKLVTHSIIHFKVIKASDRANDIVLAKVNGDSYGDLSNKYNIEGFPTILLFKAGSKKGKEYQGPLTAKGVLDFLHAQLD